MTHFCYHPFNGLEIDNDGTLRPCCKFKDELYPNWPTFNVRDGIQNYLNSNALKNLQNDFNNGVKPDACIRCWKDEDAGFASKRQMDSDRWANFINGNNIKFLTLPIGNLCNLKCRICSPLASSSWIKEYKDLYGKKIEKQEWHKDPTVWKEIIEISKDCLEIHIHGGEPFLYSNTEHIELINQIVKSKQSTNIRLHYSTNGTVMPVDQLYDLWENFKWVDIQISLDDWGKRFEYNRFPAKWPNVETNLEKYLEKTKKYTNHQLSVSTTVSAFTIYYLDNFFNKMAEIGMPAPWLGRLNTPAYYRPSVFLQDSKKIIEEKLLQSKHTDVINTINWLKEENTEWLKFVEAVQIHDNYRNEKFSNVFPELAKIINLI